MTPLYKSLCSDNRQRWTQFSSIIAAADATAVDCLSAYDKNIV